MFSNCIMTLSSWEYIDKGDIDNKCIYKEII